MKFVRMFYKIRVGITSGDRCPKGNAPRCRNPERWELQDETGKKEGVGADRDGDDRVRFVYERSDLFRDGGENRADLPQGTGDRQQLQR